jgi:hypothetical protein
MGETPVLFVKIERLRRLYRAERISVPVSRGADGTFGLGLSDDNEVSKYSRRRRSILTKSTDVFLV